LLYHCKAAWRAANGTIEGWFMQAKDFGSTRQLRSSGRTGILIKALAGLLLLAAISGCDVQRRKSDAELGLSPQQSAGRRIYDDRCDRCHEPYSTRGKKGPGLQGVFQHKYLSLSGLPANDERVTDIIRLGRNEMPGYSQTLSSQDIQDLLVYLHTL
jgi:mono/diheme cytochrome c family protein